MESEHKLYARDELYRMLGAALIKKKPQPPEDWSVVKLDEEVTSARSDFEPNLFSRHSDALATCVFYLVDFARRMPDWINLSTETGRVREMCGDLADEIEQITYEPEAVIAKHGKLKAWLKAKLAVQTCLIYREETERVIAQEAEAKLISRTKQPVRNKCPEKDSQTDKWQSDLARSIFQKVSGKSTENSSAQPSLF
jgi:primosomal protein N''